jgi:hypothetical protein
VGFEPTCARSNRAGASLSSQITPPAGSSKAESASLTKRRLGVRIPRRGPPLIAQPGRGTGSRRRTVEVRLLLGGLTPLKLSSAERPPCKRTGVGSIPTWGSDRGEPMVPPRPPSSRGNGSEVPTPRSPTGRGARLRPGRFVVRIHAGGSAAGSTPLDATSFNRQDARLLPGACWFDPSRRSLAAALPSTKECGERRECGAL